jgi:hypothetical protein
VARHITTVAVLLLVHGASDLVVGLALCGLALAMAGGYAPQALPAEPAAAALVFGPAFVGAGVLKVAAGLANHAYRHPRLGLAALASCVVSMALCVSAPLSLALLVFGLRVYRHPQSERAFTMGAQGLSREWIAASFHRP